VSASFAYDHAFDPPAPLAHLRLVGLDGGAALLVQGLIDTGADCTLVPARLAHLLNLPEVDRIEIAGVVGGRAIVPVHAGRVELAGRGYLARLVAYEDEVIVGRDILNQIVTRLDGPRFRIRLSAR
jgi:predicted aspartyl protease